MRRSHLLLALLTAITCGVAAHPADAALAKSRPVIVKDAAGDATGLGVAAPISQPDGDILSFKVMRKDNGKKATHLVARLQLAAAPTQGHHYRILMSAEGCSSYNLEFEFPVSALPTSAYLRDNCPGVDATGSTFNPVDGQIRGNTIIWTVPIRGLPGDVRLGDDLKVTGAQVVMHLGAVLFGTLDTAPAPAGTMYTVGQ